MADLEQKRWEVYSSVLASTGLTLRYSAEASTASYDILKKEVVLPIWECLDETATQALASHEIGHAKHSDFDLDVFKEMTERYGDLFNVVEDARIERLMKMEFLGLGAIFKNGYKTLADEGIFPMEGIEKAPLVERLNAFAKFGFMKDIPFSKDEAAFSYRLINLSTKADVVDLCEDILSYIGKKNSSDGSLLAAEQFDGPDGHPDGQNDGHPDSNSLDAENDESDDGGESQESKDGQDGDDSTSGNKRSIQRELTDSRMRQMEKTIAEESKRTSRSRSSDDENNVLILNSNLVMDAAEIKIGFDSLKKWQFSQTARGKRREIAKMVEKIAQSAASLFNQKQSAEANASRKRRIVGRIDARRLASYSISNAIFKQTEKIANGKSHGVVLLLDYSISMEDADGVLLCACIQAAILARFCQMVKIPFSVYLFGCGVYSEWNGWHSEEVLKIASDEWLDIDLMIAIGFTKHNSMKSRIRIPVKDSEWLICSGCSTPLIEAVIAGRRDILRMKSMGIEKPVMFIATDGAYNDCIKNGTDSVSTRIINARKIILDGKPCGEADFKNADRNRIHSTGGLAFELLARHLKKESGTDIVYSSIASTRRFVANIGFWRDIARDWNAGRIGSEEKVWMQNYIESYLYKHSFIFNKPIPDEVADAIKKCVFSKASIEGDSIIDLFMTMNTSVLEEIEGGSKKINGADPDAILSWLKASNDLLQAYRCLASTFVEFFA